MREAGLAVVREMMSKSRDIGLRNGSHGGITAASIGGMSTEVPSSSTALGSAESSTSGSDSSSSSSSSSSSHAGTETAPEDNGSSTTGACICARHFEAALNRVRPSVTLQDRQR